MNKFCKIILACISFWFALEVSAQQYDLERAKSLIEKGEYTEGAKILRPLAENGNAEAQQLAAWLFFSGNGVVRSDEQGVKYATMAAEQGNVEAIKLLIDYCCNTSQDDKAVEVFGTYATRFPDAGTQLIRSVGNRSEDENYRKTLGAYFENKRASMGLNHEDFLEKLYETDPVNGELFVELSISSRGDDENYYKQLGRIVEQEGKTSKALPILSKMTFEGRGTRQNYLKAMQYASAAIQNKSAMADYLMKKYGKKRMPGFVFSDAIMFSVDKSAGSAMVFGRKTVECTWQNIQTNLKQQGKFFRLPTKKEAKEMMPYYCHSKNMKAGETVTIWAVRLVLAEVYYWQTYDHEGNLIKEEPHHNFRGSAYNGNVTLLPVWEIGYKE